MDEETQIIEDFDHLLDILEDFKREVKESRPDRYGQKDKEKKD